MTGKIRILYTIPNFITAGSGQALVNIIQRLDRERFEAGVCVSRSGNSKLEAFLKEMGVPVLVLPSTLPPKPYVTLIPRAAAAAKAFRPHRYDIWHSFHYSDDYTEAIIARLAGARAWVFTKKNMGWNQRSWFLRSLFARAILAQNTDMLARFFNRWPLRQKVRLVPRGVDTRRFTPTTSSGHFRNALGIPDDQSLVGCVAHLVPVKGHLTLIEAAAQIADVHLLLAGKCNDSDHFAQVQALVRQLNIEDRVHFLGNVSDIPDLLAELDLVVLPTWGRWRMEGCPVALLEAMACGKACIATDVPGSRDILTHGENGWLVPPEDPQALGEAIRLLLASPEMRERLGAAARRHMVENYSIEREVAAHEAIYEQMAEKWLR